jgi:glycine cleavage system H protein
MKEIKDLALPDDYKYSPEHEWIKKDGDLIQIGITDYAQDQLGDIVFVEFPEVGDSFDKDETFGTLESVKAVSDMFLPVGGEIVEINEALEDEPELLNSDPNGAWIIKIKPSDESELDSLLSKDDYLNQLGNL